MTLDRGELGGVVAGAPRAYRIVGTLGQGGFGRVYEAELLGPGGFVRPVALKVLHPEWQDDVELAQRLRDEARMLALVRHRGVVSVDELTVLEGRWTVVMERVAGADLQRLLGAGPLPARAALEAIAEVADALHAAHAAVGPEGAPLGLVHRDLKPSNVLVTHHGEVKLADFGVARGRFAGREAATHHVAYGSPGYSAPERAELVDGPAGDVYSAGVVLFEAVTGGRFGRAGHSPRNHARRVDAALATAAQADVPDAVRALIAATLAFDPEARPTAREVEARARASASRLGGHGLRDWAPGAIAGLRPASARPAAPTAATVRDQTVWEEVDLGHTVAQRAPAPPAPPPALPRLPPLPPPPRHAPRTVLLPEPDRPTAPPRPPRWVRAAWVVVGLAPTVALGAGLALLTAAVWLASR